MTLEHRERHYQPALMPKEIPDWKEYRNHGRNLGSIQDIEKGSYTNRFSRLRFGLTNFLKGQSLGEWVERETTELLKRFGYLYAPVRLEQYKDLLTGLKINEIRFKVGLPERGLLSIQEDGFLVTLDPTFFPPFGSRAVLAHEIAHIFFCIKNSHGQVHSQGPVYFSTGDRDLEWACWYIARNLLVPTSLLRKKSALYPNLESNKFNIKVFFDLAEKFEVPWPLIAIRLAEDFPLESKLHKLDKG